MRTCAVRACNSICVRTYALRRSCIRWGGDLLESEWEKKLGCATARVCQYASNGASCERGRGRNGSPAFLGLACGNGGGGGGEVWTGQEKELGSSFMHNRKNGGRCNLPPVATAFRWKWGERKYGIKENGNHIQTSAL